MATLSCSAQTVCEQMHQLKEKYYGFTPRHFTEKELDAKSADLDKFWNYAKANKTEAILCLKDMILAEKNDTYFSFDASSLLLQLDDKEQYLDVVAEGIKKANLNELQLESYLRICLFLGKKGKDIRGLTEKLIREPNAHVYLVEHVITLSAAEASLFLYNTMSTSTAEESLINIIEHGNSTGKANAAIVLEILSTPKGDSVINDLVKNKSLPDSVAQAISGIKKEFSNKNKCDTTISRDELLRRFKSYPGEPGEGDHEVAGNANFICSACKNLKPEDADIVRAARQKSIIGLSDESLYEYFTLTKILMAVRSK